MGNYETRYNSKYQRRQRAADECGAERYVYTTCARYTKSDVKKKKKKKKVNGIYGVEKSITKVNITYIMCVLVYARARDGEE